MNDFSNTYELSYTTIVLFVQCVIAADNFDSMFIWSGKGTQNSEHDILRKCCKDHIEQASVNRFPAPITFTFNEGDSMARRFTSRLVPSHGDKEEDWVKNLFRMYDKASGDLSFRHWIDFVTNVKSKKWQHGTSLCDC